MTIEANPELVWGAMVIRPAVAADWPTLERLAELDSAEPLRGRVLIGEVRGRAVAALQIDGEQLIADPLVSTADLAELLRVRADQIRRRSKSRRAVRRRSSPAGAALPAWAPA